MGINLFILMIMIIIYLSIFKCTIAAVHQLHQQSQQSKKINHRDDDGLLVSSSLLHKPLSFASTFNEDSVLSGLFKRHKNAIMNRNHALISISHPHYSLYFQPYPSYMPQTDLLMNSLMPINPLLSVMPEYSIVPPITTSQLLPLSMRNYFQHGQTLAHQSPIIIPNSAAAAADSSIYKNIANSPITNQFNGDDQSLQNAINQYRHQNHNNKHKIQIGQKFSQSIYANSHNLRYENPQIKGKPTADGSGSRTSGILKSEQNKNSHHYRLPARLSSIAKNPYYGVLNDDDDDHENEVHKKITANNVNENKRKSSLSSSSSYMDDVVDDSKEEKGFF
ncbi:hypothetical protein DERP_004788 [Dermatophagoides pteronyssinus]|uniref:Uncharacterized protein n=1 Tax=Dermatophagoides pteronyssinus TaxID=6956 RepID=A0ABQ8JSJ1_DERPT|nr:hypothetical protein DERP_004788 [Dermatophagoides pteronyssinus]